MSAAGYLREVLGASIAIGLGIMQVQARFKAIFGLGDEFVPDGRQFDRLLTDNETLVLGNLAIRVLTTPGHTGDSLTYLIGAAAFVGDTMFAPDTGTARCDFPGGDAVRLYQSIQKILALPASTRLYLCHDYPPAGRTPAAETNIAAQREHNIHVRDGVTAAAFVAMRNARDRTLSSPRLILPALQVNIRGGRLPPADQNGIRYLKLPLNQLGNPT